MKNNNVSIGFLTVDTIKIAQNAVRTAKQDAEQKQRAQEEKYDRPRDKK